MNGALCIRSMEITYSYQGQDYRREFTQSVISIGRPSGAGFPDLDLSPDLHVSRQHARIWHENGNYWIEDLNSRFGTFVNGEPLTGKTALGTGDTILLGETMLKAVFSSKAPAPPHAHPVAQIRNTSELSLEKLCDIEEQPKLQAAGADLDCFKTMERLLEMPFRMSREEKLDDVLQHLLECTLSTIPGALRGIVLLYNEKSNDFRLHAQVAMNIACVDETLARRTVVDACGLFCHRAPQASPGVAQSCGHSAMYAPLFRGRRPLGLVVVDNPSRNEPFIEAHLHLLMACAQQMALVLTNHRLQESNIRQRQFLDATLHDFPPIARQRLLENARLTVAPTFPPGITDAAVLAIDVQPLLTVENAGAHGEITATLHEYFSAWRDAVHKYDGVVCGRLVAAFGVLEPDPKYMENAVRAALAIQWLNKTISSQRESLRKSTHEFGMAVHCGDLFHGFAGGLEHFDFIVHGPLLQTTAALAASAPPGEILVSSELSQRVYQQLNLERLPEGGRNPGVAAPLRLKGLNESASWGTLQSVKLPA